MSSTFEAPYIDLGPNGDYQFEVNFGIRIYDNKGEVIPEVGEVRATLKGGLRVNFLGPVPLLDGNKDVVGKALVSMIISSKPEDMNIEHLRNCGFDSVEAAVEYVKAEHGEEFARNGDITIYYYKVIERV